MARKQKNADSSRFSRFPTTQWTLVRRAGSILSDEQREALNELLTQYWPVIRAHLISRKGIEPNEADDLVQNFVKDRVLENNLLAVADRDRGRFRSLLTKALDNYVANELRRRSARKRSADRAVSLDVDDCQHPANTPTPPKHTEAVWARDTLSAVLERMRRECEASGREDLWGVFQARIVGPILEGSEPASYAETASRFGFASTTRAQNALVTAKRMFCRQMRVVLMDGGTSAKDVDAEIRELEKCLSVY